MYPVLRDPIIGQEYYTSPRRCIPDAIGQDALVAWHHRCRSDLGEEHLPEPMDGAHSECTNNRSPSHPEGLDILLTSLNTKVSISLVSR